MTPPLVVMVAPNGARKTRADHPNLPISPEELAREAAACLQAGASALHVHVRDEAGRHSIDPGRYREALGEIRRAVGERMVLQITTEAVGRFSADEQMRCVRELRPEAVSLALRELVPDAAAEEAAGRFFAWLREEGIAPQFILYDPEDAARFRELHRRRVIPQARPFPLFVLGRYVDPVKVRPADLLPFLVGHDPALPWSMCAFGPAEYGAALATAAIGGHVRLGFENNTRLADGAEAPDNAALVRQLAAVVPLTGRRLASLEDTRELFRATAA